MDRAGVSVAVSVLSEERSEGGERVNRDEQ
jgi:hypothetical protein